MTRDKIQRITERDRDTFAPLRFLAEELPALASRGGLAANASPLAVGVLVTQAAVQAVVNAHAEREITARYILHCNAAERRAQALEDVGIEDAREREQLLARLTGDADLYLQGVQAVMAASRAHTQAMVAGVREDGIW
ncbi:MAG: hypothetical protein FJ100_23135 [Deltaproteobacteria bacterium]|nr:hypothetical protein [Deltaproteobacteria bacterium]